MSNRGPVQFEVSEHGRIVPRPGAGALAMTLCALEVAEPVVFVSNATSPADAIAAGRVEDATRYSFLACRSAAIRLVEHDAAVFDQAYGFCNSILWDLHHSLGGSACARAPDVLEDFETYAAVNERMAAAVVREASRLRKHDVVVRSHDYHVYLAPALVRAQRPELVLHHFVHVPWPPAEEWLALPREVRRDVYDGLLANDVVSFQTRRDAEHFRSGIRAMAGVEVEVGTSVARIGDRAVRITHNPVSVDVTRLTELIAASPVRRATELLRREMQLSTAKRKVIVRVDRIDPAKNVAAGFVAFRLLLQDHPEVRERVSFLAVLEPSRLGSAMYRRYQEEVTAAISAVNAEFGTAHWIPIRAEIAVGREVALAALQLFDVLVVNSNADGQNLVVKEASILNSGDGVVILSSLAGAYAELGEHVIGVDPSDTRALADALWTALMMRAPERRRLARGCREVVVQRPLSQWNAQQEAEIDLVRRSRAAVRTGGWLPPP
ncbi:MAG TPA: trehalose-6-phosphate synthase [Acidimicrobiales bacterium]|nr:trehalose-6-phosphate synthase [Acidimicrobiales bacterium]